MEESSTKGNNKPKRRTRMFKIKLNIIAKQRQIVQVYIMKNEIIKQNEVNAKQEIKLQRA